MLIGLLTLTFWRSKVKMRSQRQLIRGRPLGLSSQYVRKFKIQAATPWLVALRERTCDTVRIHSNTYHRIKGQRFCVILQYQLRTKLDCKQMLVTKPAAHLWGLSYSEKYPLAS